MQAFGTNYASFKKDFIGRVKERWKKMEPPELSNCDGLLKMQVARRRVGDQQSPQSLLGRDDFCVGLSVNTGVERGAGGGNQLYHK